MEKVVFTDSVGRNIEFYNPPYHLSRFSGFAEVGVSLRSQKSPNQDGATYIGTDLTERSMSIELRIEAKTNGELEELKRELLRVFNPKLGEGTLRYFNNSKIREILVAVDGVPFFPNGNENKGETWQKVQINLVAHDPYWKDEKTESDPMAAWVGGMRFPWKLPTKFATKGTAQVFNNDGDIPVPVEIIFQGPAENPIVTNTTTGEFIKVNRILGERDKLIVNTAFGKKSVLIEDENGIRTNVFNWIDLNSTFWQLIVGYNEIEYNSDSGTEKATVKINWRKCYVGV